MNLSTNPDYPVPPPRMPEPYNDSLDFDGIDCDTIDFVDTLSSVAGSDHEPATIVQPDAAPGPAEQDETDGTEALIGSSATVSGAELSEEDEASDKALAVYARPVLGEVLPPLAGNGSAALDDQLVEDEAHAASAAHDPELIWKLVALQLNNELISKYRAGMFIEHRRLALAKPGHGTFVAELKRFSEEYDISVATLYRKRGWYLAVREGFRDLLIVRLSQLDKDNWPGLFDEDDSMEAVDRFVEMQNADEAVDLLSKLLAEADEQVRAAKERAKDASVFSKTIRLHALSERQFHDADRAHKKLVAVFGAEGFVQHMIDYLVSEARQHLEPDAKRTSKKEQNRA